MLFAVSGGRELLIVGRALIGLGFAGGLMASFKAVTLWFPPRRWPLVNGCFLAMGGLGATMATKPVAFLLTVSDWRTIVLWLGAITAGAALLIFLLVPREPPQQARLSLAHQLAGLGGILRDPYFWRLAPVAITTLATGLAIQGLWAGPWLRDVAGFAPPRVADYLFAINIGMMLGMVGSGVLTDLLGRLGLTAMQSMTGYLVIYLAAQALLVWPLDPTALLPWVTFGFMCNMAVLVYSQLAVYFPLHFAGTAQTGLNMLMMGGAFLVQYGVGAIIDLWPPTAGGGYAPAGYAVAFAVLLALEAASLLWFLLPRGAPHPR
jgi:predicted MFS family arabinose efflux permease